MQLLIPAAFLAFLVWIVIAFRSHHRKPEAEPGESIVITAAGGAHYESRKQLLTPCELNFFRVLEQSVPHHVWINSKVRLADVIKPKHSRGKGALNRITAKHLDFVLCDKNTSQILCAIELNDSSHNTLEAGVRDSFVENALLTSGIKLLAIKAAQRYSPEELRSLIGLQPTFSQTIEDPDARYKPKDC